MNEWIEGVNEGRREGRKEKKKERKKERRKEIKDEWIGEQMKKKYKSRIIEEQFPIISQESIGSVHLTEISDRKSVV